MRLISLLIVFVSIIKPAQAEFVIPHEIVVSFVQSSIGESGGLYIYGVDEDKFISYIQNNWKVIVDNTKSLPLHPHEKKLNSEISLTSLCILAAACERLPPLEYLDFLDQMIVIFEQDKNTRITISNVLLGIDRKHDFLSVNWEHPRVRTILAKAKQLIPPDNVDLLSCVDDMASGALADNYRTNVSGDVPNPETLPGIKLVRPWDSLIRKYERMTGKKHEEPHDSQFNPRPEKRDGTSDFSTPALADASPSVKKKQWMICGLLLLAIASAAGIIWARFKKSDVGK
jgi:hypothetical protein